TPHRVGALTLHDALPICAAVRSSATNRADYHIGAATMTQDRAGGVAGYHRVWLSQCDSRVGRAAVSIRHRVGVRTSRLREGTRAAVRSSPTNRADYHIGA